MAGKSSDVGVPGDVDAAEIVDRDPGEHVVAAASEEGRVFDHRIDDERQLGIVVLDLEAELLVAEGHEAAGDRLAARLSISW